MKPPSRAETDARVDQNLAKAKWVDPEGVDGIRVELYKNDYHDFRVLQWRFQYDPHMQKTPQALQHYDELCQRILRHEDSLALSTRAQHESKVNAGFHAQAPIRPNRDMAHLTGVWQRLALSGALGDEQLEFAQESERRRLTEEDNDKEDNDGTSET